MEGLGIVHLMLILKGCKFKSGETTSNISKECLGGQCVAGLGFQQAAAERAMQEVAMGVILKYIGDSRVLKLPETRIYA